MSRPRLFYSCLFVVSYIVGLFYLWNGERNRAAETIGAPTVSAPVERAVPLTSETVTDNGIAAYESPQHGMTAPSPAPSQMSAEGQSVANDFENQLLHSNTMKERSAAISHLIENVTPETLQVLVRVLDNDDLPQNRLRAVEALGNIARQGGDHGVAIAALTQARSNRDAAVAQRATEALSWLENHEDAP